MRAILLMLCLATLAAAEEQEQTECEICGGTVYQTPRNYVSGNTRYVYIDKPRHNPYCTRCQIDVNNGKIDPNDPPLLSNRDDEPPPDVPADVEQRDPHHLSDAKREHHKRGAHSAFGAWPWVIAICVAMFTLIRKLLK